MKKLKVAIAGAGIGSEHLQGYLANPQLFEVAVICDPVESRARPLLERSDASYVKGYEQALLQPDIDVLDICLPPGLHKAAILRALDAGKHVVCEKPLVESLADVDEIVSRAANSERCVMPVFQYRFGNGIGKLCKLIDIGLAGSPLIGSLETHWNRDADYYSVPWRGKWATELGGAIVGHAIHSHDLLVQVLGPISDVQARLSTRVNDIEVEDCAAIAIGMQCGALVSSSVTLGSAVDQSRLRFCFSDLTAQSTMNPYNPGTDPWEFKARGSASQADIEAALADYPTHQEGFARQFELAYPAFTQGVVAPVTLTDARASIELISAIYESSRKQSMIELPLNAGSASYPGWLPA